MKKFLRSFFIMLFILLLPIGGFFIYGNCIQKDVYGETYYAELKEKVERLKNVEEKKIVFIGGSSLIFGLRSEEIEKSTGYKIVDFGLYASLGTSLMINLAEPYIKKDDVVILAPEINEQTYSNYIGYEAALKCFENMNYPINRFDPNENMKFFFHYFRYVIDKGNAKIELTAPYDKASFNEFGDIDNEIVGNNIIASYYDESQLIEPSKSLLNKEFIHEINGLNNRLNKKGAKLFFSFSPTNALALKEENLEEFNEELNSKLKCNILGSVKEFTYHQYYFYDTNFHLNRTGSYLHSKNLSNLLKESLNIENNYEIEVGAVPEPKYFASDIIETIGGANYRQVYSNKKLTYSFVGLSEEYKNVESFEIPSMLRSIPVTSYEDKPFINMPNLTTVIIPETIESMTGYLFENCPNVTGLYLKHSYPPVVRSEGLLDGANENCKIYIKKEVIRNFTNDYTWVNYRSKMASY